jgi:hypothetical protein
MQVRCPKCRFKFDMYAAPGIKELSCVCPRCGTPFVYTVPDVDGKDVAEDERMNPVGDEAEPAEVDQTETSYQSPQLSNHEDTDKDTSSEEHIPEFVNPYTSQDNHEEQKNNTPSPFGVKPRIHQRGMIPIIVFVILLVIAFFAMRSCFTDKSYTSDSVYNNGVSDNDEDTDESVDSSATKDDFTEIHPSKAPRWIQGKWTVATDYGSIDVTIRGDHIYETSGGETSRGKYYYENGKLNCDYGDGSVIIYQLDESRRLIDAGDGLFMHKVK